jgi:hypothetical protein
MDSNIIIVSNNPLALNNCANVEAVDGIYWDVLIKVRDYIHAGHKLLTHPLAGSVKPNETPYKSIIVSSRSQGFDADSLKVIEAAMSMTRKMLADKPTPEWPERIKIDFQVIDKSLLDSALTSLAVY